MGERRNFWLKLAIWTALVGFTGGLYALIGDSCTKFLYEKRSLGILSEIMAGRDVHPLSFYTVKADAFMKYVLFWMLLMGFMVIAIVSQGKAVVRQIGKGFGYILLIGFSILFAFFIGEIVVRMTGFKPWDPSEKPIPVEPGGRLAELHPTLGYAMIPGRYTVTLPDGYKFTVTHGNDFLRITSPLNASPVQPNEGEIWIFGCSFTYGWSLNDEQTYPWLLQEKFKNYKVVNFGTIGYGTLHALTQFREALKAGRKPVVAINAYGSFHDERNTFLRSRRKAVGPNNKLGPFRQPYARLRNGQLYYAMTKDVDYHEFPLMRHSALINLIEECYNKTEAKAVNSPEVTERTLVDFDRTANGNGIPFVVAGIDSDSSTVLSEMRARGISTVDISVDLSNPIYRNGPHDSHPSALANQKYAENLAVYLRKQPWFKSQ
ncbi:MAG: SGNH/GDSL hydrolase family protein [Candidatus Omnitrophota bacterium]